MNKFFYFILFFPLIIFSQDWNQIGEDIDGLAAGDWTGTAVSTNNSGDIIAIGENHSTYYNGRVRVFQKSSYNSWIQIGQSLYGDGQGSSFWSANIDYQGERFGYNISLFFSPSNIAEKNIITFPPGTIKILSGDTFTLCLL